MWAPPEHLNCVRRAPRLDRRTGQSGFLLDWRAGAEKTNHPYEPGHRPGRRGLPWTLQLRFGREAALAAREAPPTGPRRRDSHSRRAELPISAPGVGLSPRRSPWRPPSSLGHVLSLGGLPALPLMGRCGADVSIQGAWVTFGTTTSLCITAPRPQNLEQEVGRLSTEYSPHFQPGGQGRTDLGRTYGQRDHPRHPPHRPWAARPG